MALSDPSDHVRPRLTLSDLSEISEMSEMSDPSNFSLKK